MELHNLLDLGLMIGKLRRMVLLGYIEHAVEVTRPQDRSRKFQPARNLCFHPRSCFVLAEAGVRFFELLGADGGEADAMAVVSPAASMAPCRPTPQWDGQRRVLRFEGQVVKHFKVPSSNQEVILAAFQEEGWPTAIDDPLPFAVDLAPKYRLRQAIRRLNNNQENRLLRFRGDGTGERILWEEAADSVVECVVSRPAVWAKPGNRSAQGSRAAATLPDYRILARLFDRDPMYLHLLTYAAGISSDARFWVKLVPTAVVGSLFIGVPLWLIVVINQSESHRN